MILRWNTNLKNGSEYTEVFNNELNEQHDELNSDIDKVAKIDEEYADIVGVLDHKFVPSISNKRTNLNLLLTWDNDMDPKLYPWNSSLGANERIHEDLKEHRMRMYIPQKYTHPRDHPEEIARRLKRKNDQNTKQQTKRKRTRSGF